MVKRNYDIKPILKQTSQKCQRQKCQQQQDQLFQMKELQM
jgi:hypothetical protein